MSVDRLDEMWKAASATSDCLKASPYESDSTHSPFMTRHGLPIFNYYAKDPRRAGRFAKAMAGAAKCDSPLFGVFLLELSCTAGER